MCLHPPSDAGGPDRSILFEGHSRHPEQEVNPTDNSLTWLTLPAESKSLSQFTEFICRGAGEIGIDPADFGYLELILEDLVINIATHAYSKGHAGQIAIGYAESSPGVM